MQNGSVKWFDDAKGFGFIQAAGKDYFVHYKQIKSDGFKSLKEGQKVTFEASSSPKGWVATNVQPE
jgi:CspA family cold shock protein